MTFPAAYCLFSLWCFAYKGPAIGGFYSQDANRTPLDCPHSCLCYIAPKDHFGIDDKSNSMICEGEQVEPFNRYFGPNQPKRPEVKLNTIVLKDLKNLKEKTIVLNADSVVLENIPNLKDLTIEGNFRYLTIYAQTDLPSLPDVKSPELREIYILGSFDKAKTEFVPPTQSFLKLESFTIQQSHLQAIRAKQFFAASSTTLKTLDLSRNELISVDSIISTNQHYRNYVLTNLYLNDNLLTTIPHGLKYTYPNIKTLHLHRNQIKILDIGAIQQLFTIQEFILFDLKNAQSWEIYHYGGIETWFPDANTKQMPIALGLLDSLPNLNIVCANEKQLKVKYELKMDLSTCEKWKFHPEKAYQDKTQFFLGMHRHKNIDLRGPVFDLRRQGVNIGLLDDKHTAVWLQFSVFYQKTEKNYFELRNFGHVAQLLSYQVIFRFNNIEKAISTKNDHKEVNDMLTYVLNEPNFVGFEIEIFDAEFAGISLDQKANQGDCPLIFPAEELKKKFYDRVGIYKQFTTKLYEMHGWKHSDAERYLFFVTIDAKCLDIAKMFIQEDQVKKCFRDDNVQIDGVSFVNIDTEDADYQKHKTLITDFESFSTKATFKEVHSGKKDPLRMVSMADKLP